jgi:tetratricopeptide (TPR) repeat protein
VDRCPDENELALLLGNELDAGAREEIERHLDSCATCRRIVAEVARAVSPEDATGPAAERLSLLGKGATIDRYVVLSVLGAGAMGVVYTAYDPELDRRVAIKLVRPAVGGREAQARLLREAQAMARLSHRNAVTVFDAGTVGEDVYLVMELVFGKTLALWLAERPRLWREVLAAFVQAGRGLEAAHAAGIVHRDFKPENALVGSDGRVVVGDFGLARAASAAPDAAPGQAPALDITATGAILGTPAYMSPEQLRGEPADARTDVFSFSVALYEALYRERPFAGATVEQLREAIAAGRVREPPRGVRVPVRIRRALLWGLRPRPSDRPPSMGELLAALERDPRRAMARAAVAVLFLGLVGALVLVSVRDRAEERRVCVGADRKLDGVWDAPRREAIRAAFLGTGAPFAREALRRTERHLDAYSRDWVKMHTEACEATRLRGEQSEMLLDLRMRCLAQRREELGALTAIFAQADREVVTRAAQGAHSLGALRDCADARGLQSPVPLPRDEAQRAEVERVRRSIARIRALDLAGRYRDGLKQASGIVAEARALRYRPVEAEALALLATFEKRLARWGGAARTWREAIRAVQAGHDEKLAARALAELGWAFGYQGKSDLALDLTRHAAAIVEGIGGDVDLEGLIAHYVGGTLIDIGRYDESVQEFEVAARKRSAALGPDHPDVGSVLVNIGVARLRQGRYEDALSYYQKALSIQERSLGADHPTVGHTLFNVAGVLAGLRRFSEARPAAERAYRVLNGALGPEHPLIATALSQLGDVAALERRFQAAVGYLERAVAMGERTRDPKDAMLAAYHESLGRARAGLRRFTEARAAYRHALELHVAREGVKLNAAQVWAAIGRTFLEEGALDRAIRELRRALPIQEREDGPTMLAETRFALARALWRAGREKALARRLGEQAVDAYRKAGSAFERELREAQAWLGRISAGGAPGSASGPGRRR